MQITKGKVQKAQKVVVYGPEGIGKSTFAAQFPNPLFIDTEGSTNHMDVARTPKPSRWSMLMQQVAHVRDHPDLCGTLILDTADWAEQLCMNEVCARAKKQSIEDFGYGKGYVYLAEEFGRLLNLLDEVIDRGIHVCFTAHAKMRKFEQPDELGAYDRWEMKLQKQTAPLLKEWADLVLFANYKTYVVNVDDQGVQKGKNKVQGGARVMYTTHHPCWDAKNRHELAPELPFAFQEIARCIPVMDQTMPPAPEPPAQEAPPPATEPEPTQAPVVEQPTRADTGLPKALVDLMIHDMVTVQEIQEAVAAKQYFPRDMPVADYPEDFVNGVLIGAWPQVLAMVEAGRPPDYKPTGTPF